jgi:hypothetical protein
MDTLARGPESQIRAAETKLSHLKSRLATLRRGLEALNRKAPREIDPLDKKPEPVVRTWRPSPSGSQSPSSAPCFPQPAQLGCRPWRLVYGQLYRI